MTNATAFFNNAWQVSPLALNGTVRFSNTFFKEVAEDITDLSSTIKEPLKFDGYSCIDNKEKLYFSSSTSYA
jgi:hypothetical protein